MLAFRSVSKCLIPAAKLVVLRQPARVISPIFARNFSAGHHAPAAPAAGSDEVIVPELESSLEWLLESPCPVHQFDEPPIIVEIEHLDNLIVHDH